MPLATDLQVQNFVDQRVRVRCEQIRALANALNDDIASIGDVYAALTQATPTWEDSRTDGPPNLLTVADVLNINAFINSLSTAIDTDAQLPVVLKACVRPVSG